MMNKYIIDAKDRVPGRVATEVAVLLMGKNRTDFARNRIPDVLVEVVSCSQMSLSAKKCIRAIPVSLVVSKDDRKIMWLRPRGTKKCFAELSMVCFRKINYAPR